MIKSKTFIAINACFLTISNVLQYIDEFIGKHVCSLPEGSLIKKNIVSADRQIINDHFILLPYGNNTTYYNI